MLKTMYARWGNVKVGKFIASQEEQNSEGYDASEWENLNDIENVLSSIGIKMKENATTYREFDDVLAQLGEGWKNYDEVTQNALATAIAGVRQRENFITLMDNWGQTLEYASIAANANGTAEKKMEAYNESLAASMNRVTAEFEKFTMSTNMQHILIDVNNSIAFLIRNLKTLANIFLPIIILIKKKSIFNGFINFIASVTTGLASLNGKLVSLRTNLSSVDENVNKISLKDNIQQGMNRSILAQQADSVTSNLSKYALDKNLLDTDVGKNDLGVAKINAAALEASMSLKTLSLQTEQATLASMSRMSQEQREAVAAYLTQDITEDAFRQIASEVFKLDSAVIENIINLKKDNQELAAHAAVVAQDTTYGQQTLEGFGNGKTAKDAKLGMGLMASSLAGGLGGAALGSGLGETGAIIGGMAGSVVPQLISAINPIAGMLTGVGVGIIGGITSLVKQSKREALENAKEDLDSVNEKISSVGGAEEKAKEYDKLSKGVNNYGKNISLTDEEYEKFISLGNELSSLFPTLVVKMDEAGNSFLGIDGSIGNVTDSVKELVNGLNDLKNTEMASDEIFKDTFNTVADNLKNTQKEINNQKKITWDITTTEDGAFKRGHKALLNNLKDKDGNRLISTEVQRKEIEVQVKAFNEREKLTGDDAINFNNDGIVSSLYANSGEIDKLSQLMGEIEENITGEKITKLSNELSEEQSAIQESIIALLNDSTQGFKASYDAMTDAQQVFTQQSLEKVSLIDKKGNKKKFENYKEELEELFDSLNILFKDKPLVADIIFSIDDSKAAVAVAQARKELLTALIDSFGESFDANELKIIADLGFSFDENKIKDGTKITDDSVNLFGDSEDKITAIKNLYNDLIAEGKDINSAWVENVDTMALTTSQAKTLYNLLQENPELFNENQSEVMNKVFDSQLKNASGSELYDMYKVLENNAEKAALLGKGLDEIDKTKLYNVVDRMLKLGNSMGISYEKGQDVKKVLEEIADRSKAVGELDLFGGSTKTIDEYAEEISNLKKIKEDLEDPNFEVTETARGEWEKAGLDGLVASSLMGASKQDLLKKVEEEINNQLAGVKSVYLGALEKDEDFSKEVDPWLYKMFGTLDVSNQVLKLMGEVNVDWSNVDINEEDSVANSVWNSVLQTMFNQNLDLSKYFGSDAELSKRVDLIKALGISNKEIDSQIEKIEWGQMSAKTREALIAKFNNYIAQGIGFTQMGANSGEIGNAVGIKANGVMESKGISTPPLQTKAESMGEMGDALKSLETAYNEFTEEGKLSYSAIKDINKEFSDVKGIEEYIDKLNDTKITAQELVEILGLLTEGKKKEVFTTEELAKMDEVELGKMYEEEGMTNGLVVAHEDVANAKTEMAVANIEATHTSAELVEMGEDGIQALLEEGEASNVAANAAAILETANYNVAQAQLNSTNTAMGMVSSLGEEETSAGTTAGAFNSLLDKFIAYNNTILSSENISPALQTIANAASTAAAWVQELINKLFNLGSATSPTMSTAERMGRSLERQARLQDALDEQNKKKTQAVTTDNTTPQYGGTNTPSGSGGSDKDTDKDTLKDALDLIQKRKELISEEWEAMLAYDANSYTEYFNKMKEVVAEEGTELENLLVKYQEKAITSDYTEVDKQKDLLDLQKQIIENKIEAANLDEQEYEHFKKLSELREETSAKSSARAELRTRIQLQKEMIKLADTEEERLEMQKEYNSLVQEEVDARKDDLEEWLDKEEAFGRMTDRKKLASYEVGLKDLQNTYQMMLLDPDVSKKQLEDLSKLIEEYQKKIIELQKNVFDKTISDIEKAISKLGDSAPKEWTSISDIKEYSKSVIGYYQQMIDSIKNSLATVTTYSEEQVEDLIDKLNEYQKAILEAQIEEKENIKEQHEKIYEALTSKVEEYIDAIEKQKEKISEAYDKEIKKMKEANEEKENSIKLTQLQQNLEDAYHEKKKVFRNGVGWVYETDRNKVKEAQKAIADYNFDTRVNDLEKAKDKELEILDKEIKNWQDYLEAQKEVYETYEDQRRDALLFEELAVATEADLHAKLLADRDNYILNYKDDNKEYLGEMTSFYEQYKTNLEALQALKEKELTLYNTNGLNIASIGNYGQSNVYNSESIAQKKAQMAANSAAWHDSNKTEAEKNALHQANERLANEIAALEGSDVSFNKDAGTWSFSSDYGNGNGGSANVDYSAKMAGSTTTAELEHWAQKREEKIKSQGIDVSGSGYKTTNEIISEVKNAKGFANGLEGGAIRYTGLTMLHGTLEKPEYVVNDKQAKGLLNAIDSTKTPKYEKTLSTIGGENYNFYGDLNLPNVVEPQQFFSELLSATDRRINIKKN